MQISLLSFLPPRIESLRSSVEYESMPTASRIQQNFGDAIPSVSTIGARSGVPELLLGIASPDYRDGSAAAALLALQPNPEAPAAPAPSKEPAPQAEAVEGSAAPELDPNAVAHMYFQWLNRATPAILAVQPSSAASRSAHDSGLDHPEHVGLIATATESARVKVQRADQVREAGRTYSAAEAAWRNAIAQARPSRSVRTRSD